MRLHDYTTSFNVKKFGGGGEGEGGTGSKYDFSIRRMDLKTMKNTLGRVTWSVN